MSLDFLKAKAAVGCFGKLPIYADFIKLRSENHELKRLDGWIQEGLHFAKSKLENNFKEQYRNNLFFNFIYQPKASDRSIGGILFPGTDKSGRCYPFIIFIPLSRYRIDSRLGFFLTSLQDQFFSNAAKIASCGWVGLDPGNFLKKYFNWNIFLDFDKEIKKDYQGFIKEKTLDSYFRGMSGSLDQEKKFLVFQNLLDTVRPLSRENYHRFSLGIKFPLSGTGKNGRELTFWIDLLSKILSIKKAAPSLFWNNRENRNLYFFLHEPQPKHFLSLLGAAPDTDEGVCDLSLMRSSRIDEVKGSISRENLKLLESPQTTLDTLLHKLKT